MPIFARSSLRMTLRSAATLLVALLAYYLLPVGDGSGLPLPVAVAGFVLGLLALTTLVIQQIRTQVQSMLSDGAAQIERLLIGVYLVVVFFSAGYVILETTEPSSFEGLATKTDALYFTVTTLTTVGYGDVHASSQLARLLVTIQLLFDVLFVAIVVRIISANVGRRVQASEPPPKPPRS